MSSAPMKRIDSIKVPRLSNLAEVFASVCHEHNINPEIWKMAAKRPRTSARTSDAELKSTMMVCALKANAIGFPHLSAVVDIANGLKTSVEQRPEAVMQGMLDELDVRALKALYTEINGTNDVQSRLKKLTAALRKQSWAHLDIMTEAVDSGRSCLVDSVALSLLWMSGDISTVFNWDGLKKAILDTTVEKARVEGVVM